MALNLDRTDWKILRELDRDARISYSELGRRVGLSQPAAADRVKALEQSGLIRGYRVELDYEKLGLPVHAIIRISGKEFNCVQIGKAMKGIPEVVECHRLTGSDSVIVRAVVASVRRLEQLIDKLSGYGSLTTSLVLSTPVEARTAWPDAVAVNSRTQASRRARTAAASRTDQS